jgi:hypothetical protein
MTQPYLYIQGASHLDGYVLSLDFSSGVTKQVDFAPFILNALHPDVQKYRDLERFKQFTVADGDLYWNDYELCFPVADLYQNQL